MTGAGMKTGHTYTHRASPIIVAGSYYNSFPPFIQGGNSCQLFVCTDFAYLGLNVYFF